MSRPLQDLSPPLTLWMDWRTGPYDSLHPVPAHLMYSQTAKMILALTIITKQLAPDIHSHQTSQGNSEQFRICISIWISVKTF